MNVAALQAKRDKTAAQLAEKHRTRAPTRLLGRRLEEVREASAREYQERKKAESRARIERMRAEFQRYEIERERRREAHRRVEASLTPSERQQRLNDSLVARSSKS